MYVHKVHSFTIGAEIQHEIYNILMSEAKSQNAQTLCRVI